MANRTDTADLTNSLIYHRYLMNDGQLRRYFKDLNIPEYLTLHMIAESSAGDEGAPGKTYLRELSGKLQLSIRQSSRVIRALRDKGLVTWAHDGNGKDGTYVSLTASGIRLMSEQEEKLKDYYGRVIEAYGKDNMLQLLQMMERLESVMASESEKAEVIPGADGATE